MARTRIREIAEAKGLDIAKLSRRSDVSYKTVWELWNNPDRDVSLRTLEKIAGALDVSVAHLIENGKMRQTDEEIRVPGLVTALRTQPAPGAV
jgi:transcriptional regulator with XRE-family HTH domain